MNSYIVIVIVLVMVMGLVVTFLILSNKSSQTQTPQVQQVESEFDSKGDDFMNLAASVLPLILSDSKFKENITFAGVENGINKYNFNYKGFPKEKFEGVLADEVILTNPESVIEENGFKFVDYYKLGVEFKKLN